MTRRVLALIVKCLTIVLRTCMMAGISAPSVEAVMLDMFFNPRAVAVIGASKNPQKLGYSVLANIIASGYAGHVYPINPKAEEILGLRCYSSVLDTPGVVDLGRSGGHRRAKQVCGAGA